MNEKKLFNRTGLGIGLYILVTIAAQLVITTIVGYFWPMALYDNVLQWVLSLAPMYLIALPVCWKILKTLPKRELFKNDMKPGLWIQMFFMSVALMYIGNIIGTILTTVLNRITGLNFSASVQDMIAESNLLAVFIFSVILAPVIEELLFRKLLIDRLIVLGDRAAIVISSIMFGVMHGNFTQIFYAFGIGLILGYVYVRTGKLKYNIGIHMLFNFLGGFIPNILLKKVDLYQITDFLSEGDIVSYMHNLGPVLRLVLFEFAMIAVGIAGFVLLIHHRKKFVLKRGELSLTKGEIAKQFVTTPGMWIWIGASVFMFVINIIW